MILSIETTNADFIKAVKAMAKLAGAKISEKKATKEHKVPNKRLLSAMKEAEKMRVDDEAYPAFSSIEELKKALEA